MKFGFYSCMSGMPWGGSEVLWQRTARLLQRSGHEVAVNFKWWPYKAPTLQHLEDHGASLWLRDPPPRPLLNRVFSANPQKKSWLDVEKPDAVLITLGYHPDAIPIADECFRRGIPYGINIQCASNSFFIHGDRLEEYRRWYRNAKKVYFVSEENQLKLENNIASKLDNSEIIANPFNVSHEANPAWPKTESEFQVALVGRVHFQSKGQDIIVDVMRQPKWRKRSLKVVFYGHDQGNKLQLLELIKLHGLEEQLVFHGFSDSVEEIWENNHALLLPSRYEGAPLVVIEAMLCNRIAITTDIGRNRELMDDNESGFVAMGTSVELLDEALERAWQKRHQWQEMGVLAGKHIRERYSDDPVRDFAEALKLIRSS
ncbi:glycosyltransferase family 4 protein [Mariniblastus sp.]|nr:glycosyltransferase family 4 protein [Mariniblastus sp.]